MKEFHEFILRSLAFDWTH